MGLVCLLQQHHRRGLLWCGRRGKPLHSCVVEERLEWSLREECGIAGGDLVFCMVSGGSDSVALLQALCRVRDKWSPPLALEVLNFDHGLRVESSRDSTFVLDLCDRLGVPCSVTRWEKKKKATQATSRAWRRRIALKKVAASKEKKAHVALAHHGDDQLETAILRLARGARLSRVFQGMQPYVDCFARPFLSLMKEDLVSYLKSNGHDWVEDASNLDPSKYARNKARLTILPQLADLAGGMSPLRRRFQALASQSKAIEDFVCEAASKEEKARSLSDNRLATHDWTTLPEVLRHELLSRFIQRHESRSTISSMLTFSHIVDLDNALLQNDEDWDRYLPSKVIVRRRSDGIDARRTTRHPSEKTLILLGDVSIVLEEDPWRYELQGGRQMPPVNDDSMVCLRDLPRGAQLELRHRKDGDRFHPPWRRRPIKLKDFLRGRRCPRSSEMTSSS